MTTPTRPLSYDSSKYVIQYLPLEQRLLIRLRCPQLRTADSVVPLKVHTLQMDTFSLRLDNIEYRFCCNGCGHEEVVRRFGCDRIIVVNHSQNITNRFHLGAFRKLNVRWSFLMHKILGGRKAPIIFENFELKRNPGMKYPYDIQKNFYFPEDMKMKVKNLEMHRVDEQVIRQLTTHIIGGPLESFRVLHVEAASTLLSNCALIQNSQKLDFPIEDVLRLSFESLPAVRHKEIIMNNGYQQSGMINFYSIRSLIEARQESNIETWADLTINIVEKSRNDLMGRLLFDEESRRAVVDGMEINQFTIPCVCFPMDQDKELVVYGIPGTITNAILKIKMMPKGSARRIDE